MRWVAPAYLALAVAVAVLLRAGDRWWPATLLLFGPRWVWLVPAPFAVLAAAALRRRRVPFRAAVACAGAATALTLFAVMGLRVPWFAPGHEGPTLRVTTLNAGAEWLEPPEAVRALLDSTDLLAVEECGRGSFEALGSPAGWHARRDGMLCVLSRWPVDLQEEWHDDGVDGGAARYRIETPLGGVVLVVLHLESPRDGLEAVERRLWRGAATLEAVTRVRAEQSRKASLWARSGAPSLVAGDFNMPIESAIYREDWTWLDNAFDRAGWGLGSTKRTRVFGARIDHVLFGSAFEARACALGPDVGSDHRPLTATLVGRATD